VPQINSELLRRGVATSAELGGRVVYFGTLEHDVEKDALPYLLPLRAPVVARWSGVPLWKYLERLGIGRHPLSCGAFPTLTMTPACLCRCPMPRPAGATA